MKRMMLLLLTLAMLLSLFSGCSGQTVVTGELTEATEETEVTTQTALQTEEASSSGEVTVSNVDELLSAIAPDTVIRMEPGTYDLAAAADYGKSTGQQYYTWVDVYDGYELTIQGVDNLTIRGSGKESTVISAQPRYANVLKFNVCTNVQLMDFTAGHTVEPGECAGGVLALDACFDMSMEGLGLYGCGIIGIRSDNCSNLSVTDCDIYECSSNGIVAEGTTGLTVKQCRIFDLGNVEYGGSGIFYLNTSDDVLIEDCEIYGNVMQWILHESYSCENVQMINNTFRDNRIRHSAFSLRDEGMVLDGNKFENNNIRIWYDLDSFNGDILAVDKNGGVVTEEMLDEANVMEEVKTELPKQNVVTVKTVDEFLGAIAPNTMIVLEGEVYDLSIATGFGTAATDYYYWEENHDGPGLVITGVDNLTICSTDADVKGHTIEAVPRYANVLTFSQCSNITVQGFTAGHTVEPGYCTGGVLCFRDSDQILVDNCSLYGCGTLGVDAQYSGNVTVTNCEIYECSYGGISMWSVDGIKIADCTFRDLGGDSIQLSECKNAMVNGESVPGASYHEA